MQKQLYDNDSYTGHLQFRPRPEIGVLLLEWGGRVGNSGKSGLSHSKGEGHIDGNMHAVVNCVCSVCGSAHSCRCVVNGSFARAAI